MSVPENGFIFWIVIQKYVIQTAIQMIFLSVNKLKEIVQTCNPMCSTVKGQVQADAMALVSEFEGAI